jgi:UDP:flavonoid glycosyltransferase YjiC (YdhE family)
MRLLFTFAGGNGHFEPLIPIAQAAEVAGHRVAFAGQPAMIPSVEAAGFTGFTTAGGTMNKAPKREPLLALDADREDRALRDGYATRIARERASAILALCTEWKPDIIICDEIDFGSIVVAERLSLPYATVLVIAAGSFVRHRLVSEALNKLRAEHDLPSDPDLTMLSRYLVLSPFPPSFRDPAFPLPAGAYTIRPHMLDYGQNEPLPSRVTFPNDEPTVYFTLGTVFNLESGDLFNRVLAGLRDMPINIIATVGREIDPDEFGPQPANIHIERFIPQSLILPQCSAVVSHGGSGSVIGALAHGLPSVLIPMGADQPLNASRCADLGVARVLDAVEAKPANIGEAVSAVLNDPTYRRAAERLRDEMAALPGPEYAIMLLERLAEEKRPL